MKHLLTMKLHPAPSPILPVAPVTMTEILKKTAGLLYSIRYVIPACALTLYVIAGLAYFFVFKYWPTLPEGTQSIILENLSWAATAPM